MVTMPSLHRGFLRAPTRYLSPAWPGPTPWEAVGAPKTVLSRRLARGRDTPRAMQERPFCTAALASGARRSVKAAGLWYATLAVTHAPDGRRNPQSRGSKRPPQTLRLAPCSAGLGPKHKNFATCRPRRGTAPFHPRRGGERRIQAATSNSAYLPAYGPGLREAVALSTLSVHSK